MSDARREMASNSKLLMKRTRGVSSKVFSSSSLSLMLAESIAIAISFSSLLSIAAAGSLQIVVDG